MELARIISMMKPSSDDGIEKNPLLSEVLSKLVNEQQRKTAPGHSENQDLQKVLEALLDGLEKIDPEVLSQLVTAIQKKQNNPRRESAATPNKDSNSGKAQPSIEEQIAKNIRSGM